MATPKTALEQLERIKKNVSTSYIYFKDNCKRYHDYRRYVFKNSVSEEQRTMLQSMQRPVTEFNILEAYISRLLGEFSKHEPSINISPSEGVPVPQQTLDVVEGHVRHIIYEANKTSFANEVYKDLLSGGFSVAKVWTDYASPMSFNQQIYLARVFDPTLTGFDPMARDSHKGDGQYSFEIYPMTLEDFKRDFPAQDADKFKFTRVDDSAEIEGFSWSYKDIQDKKIVLVVDYYEKKTKKTKIVKLANGRVMTVKDYEEMEIWWNKQQFIEQIPAIVGKYRWTDLERVCRYRLIENEVLEYTETDYSYLPHVFIDGNSAILTQGQGNYSYQMTRPYVYHAKGIQDMTNFAGQTICNSMENLIQHKFIVMKEAIPQEQDYLEALNDIQRANTIVVNAYSEDNPNQPIPTPIREVQNVPLPPEVTQSFQFAAPMTQAILGSFASNLGQNDQELSGKAVIESSSVGNAASMPYIMGYLAGLTQIGCIIVDLLPKYIVGARTIPVVDKGNNKSYQKVNQPGAPMLDYEEHAIHVNIEAGVNFQVQKTVALDTIVKLMSASEEFAAFMNSTQGLPILLDNLTIYGADRLKEASEEWLKEQQAQQQQAMQAQQQAMQQDPAFIKAQAELQKVQMQESQNQVENQLAIAKFAIEKELADAKILEAQAKVSQAQVDSAVRLEESQTSLETHALDSAAKMAEVREREHSMKMREHEAHLNSTKLQHEMEKSRHE